MSTVIRRRLPSGHEAVDAQIASRVCSNDRWVNYWLCLVGGKVYVGVGKVPGEQCLGAPLDDSLYNQLRTPMDAVKYVGLGNSAVGKNVRPLKVRNVIVTTVPDAVRTKLESIVIEDLRMINVDADQDDEAKAMMEAYEKECQKSRARAKKFGVPYKEPTPQAFLNWSKARRLRANPQKGFATGMDISTPEEMEKQRKRAERFGMPANKRERDAPVEGEENGEEGAVMEEDPLPVSVAWDNEDLVRPHRADPPKGLWVNPPEDAVEEENYAMEETGPATMTTEKIHIFSIDWSAFKQIRTDDIMAYFGSYGPSYVEWLGELSCNVHFEDQFSAARALQNMSQPLPSPPPDEIVAAAKEDAPPPTDFGRMGWSFCLHPMRKVTNDRYGRRGTTARIMMRVAASTDVLLQKPSRTPAPPPGFTTKRVLGPGSDFEEHRRKRRRKEYRDEEREEVNAYPEGDHPLMSKGLRSGRDGYSVEDMQAERGPTTASIDEVAPSTEGIAAEATTTAEDDDVQV